MPIPNPFVTVAPPPPNPFTSPLSPAVGALQVPAAAPAPVNPDDSKNDAQLTEEYIALRDEKKAICSRHADELAPLSDRMAAIEATMLARLDAQGVQSVKTTKGTAFKKTSTSFSVGDPDALFPWIEANGRTDMLSRSIRPDAMREYAEQHGTLPPGVEVFAKTVVQFRK